MRLPLLIGLLILAAMGANFASAVTLDAAFTATTPSDDFCNPGPSASAFLTTDAAVWLYVSVSNAATGDRLHVDWFRPDGVLYDTSDFNPLTGGGGWCFDDPINIAGTSAALFPGVWTIRGTWNGSAFFTVHFTVSAPGGSGSNLIQNPGAEQSTGSDCLAATSVPGWTITGPVSVCRYGSVEIDTMAPGPPDRGLNFFSGGPDNSTSSLAQRIDISTNAAAIDAGTLTYTLSGWLGGWDVQDDSASLTVTFRNASNASLGTAKIGPVFSDLRPFGTGLVQETAAGTIPSGTRNLDLVLLFSRSSGSYNDGAADNLSLVLGTGAGTCAYSISPLTNSVAASASINTVQVTAGSGCAWTAVSNVSWITITAGSSGSGNGSVSYSVAANTSTSTRSGTLTIAGKTHTVTQAAAAACTYALGSTANSVTAAGGPKAVLVTAPAGCAWTAVSNAAWITITAGASGSGNGTVNYLVSANTAASARTGTLTIAGQTHTVTQAGVVSSTVPTITSIINSASNMPATLPSGAIAQGSHFMIAGENIGPSSYQSQAAYPLPISLAGVTVAIRQGNTSVNAFLMFVSSAQINAIMPSNAPTGDVTVTVTFNGLASAPAPAQVATVNFGIFTAASGRGPGIIQNDVTSPVLNSRSVTARPGDVSGLLGTGLGAIQGADNQAPPVGDLPVSVEVTVGGRPALVSYHGRMYVAGVDMIQFQIPADAPPGCSVPVQVKAGGTYSNVVSMAIQPQGQPCSDPQNPFAPLTTVGGKAGTILLLRLSLLASLESGQPPLDATVDLGLAAFEDIPPNGTSIFSSLLSLPPVGTCTEYSGNLDLSGLLGGVTGGAAGSVAGASGLFTRPLDAGPSIAVTGPQGTIPLLPLDPTTNTGLYLGLLGGSSLLADTSLPPFLESGIFHIAGTGGADVGAFQASMTLGTPVVWTNRDQITTVNRASNLLLTWSGGDASKLVLIAGGGADSDTSAAAGFFCFVPAAPGQFTVPASMLGNLPASSSGSAIGLLVVGSVPSGDYPTFTAHGLDFGMIINATLSAITVAFQ